MDVKRTEPVRLDPQTLERAKRLAPALPRGTILRRLVALGLELAEQDPARLLGGVA